MVDENRKPPVSSSQGLLAQGHGDLRVENSLAFRNYWGYGGCDGNSVPGASCDARPPAPQEGAVAGGLVLILQKFP